MTIITARRPADLFIHDCVFIREPADEAVIRLVDEADHAVEIKDCWIVDRASMGKWTGRWLQWKARHRRHRRGADS